MSLEPLTPERRRALTREHLLEAAAVVFARNGFHGSSLDEVAAAAGFTKGAVYSNFRSKEDLFLALLEERLDRQRVAVVQALDVIAPAENHVSRMSAVLRELMWDDDWTALYLEFVLYAARNAEARAKLADSARREHEVVADMIRREYERIGAEPPFPLTTAALVSVALFNGLGMAHLFDPSVFDDEHLTAVVEFLFATIGVDATDGAEAQGRVTPPG